ncbi:MAG TPA: TolC family protein [Thermoanaerobaculia bacterium]
MSRFASMLIAALLATSAIAQERTLAEMHDVALRNDPRMRQLALEDEQTTLRLQNIDAERRPALTVEADAQYQSDVVELPFTLPGGGSPPTAPRDTYDVRLRVEQIIVDPTADARRDEERARLAEAQARVRTSLYALRQELNEAFFGAALLQERAAQLRTGITDLEARLDEMRELVAAGAALPGAAASIEATLLRRRQELLDLQAKSAAARARLARLTGTPVAAEERLVLPELAEAAERARHDIAAARRRPEYEQFQRTRERFDARKRLVDAQQEPRVLAFGRVGYGKPGLNFLNDGFDAYAVAGVRVQWTPIRWGTTERERRIAELQQEAVLADEAAFTRTLERAAEGDVALLDELDAVVQLDDRIVALRELIHRETLIRYRERVITTAEYIDAETDVLEARLVRAAHRVELAQARARLLTLLGLEVR